MKHRIHPHQSHNDTYEAKRTNKAGTCSISALPPIPPSSTNGDGALDNLIYPCMFKGGKESEGGKED